MNTLTGPTARLVILNLRDIPHRYAFAHNAFVHNAFVHNSHALTCTCVISTHVLIKVQTLKIQNQESSPPFSSPETNKSERKQKRSMTSSSTMAIFTRHPPTPLLNLPNLAEILILSNRKLHVLWAVDLVVCWWVCFEEAKFSFGCSSRLLFLS